MSEILRGNVGPNAEHAITKMRDEQGEVAIGNVLRRTCEWLGQNACKSVCQRRIQLGVASSEVGDTKLCADKNVKDVLTAEALTDKNVLIIGVTANEVGFADELDEYEPKQNPDGWKELPGFNAFFAREGEVDVLGRRLADCADINFEFTDADGNTVVGFEHGTRTNMFGKSKHIFEHEGKKVSFTEFAIGQALDHYDADPTSMQIKLAAGINGRNFQKHFDSREKMEDHIPGWYDAGYLQNVTNPDWQPGDPVIESDTWYAESRGMIIDDIQNAMRSFGIPEDNFSTDGIIDPAETNGQHSSHEYRDTYGDTRDLYMTYIPAK